LNLTAVGLGVLVYWYAGVDLFREGSVITIASVVQLATITRISMKIMQARGGGRRRPVWREPRAVWWATSLGFAFLAADDLFKIHENIDSLIHYAFDLEKNGVSDRIDDALVGIYGLVGIGLLIVYRVELKNYGEAIPYLVVGFALLFIMVALDIITNRRDILMAFFAHERALLLHIWLSLAEDTMKLFAEGFFLLGFYAALQKARRIADAKSSRHVVYTL
jgi:hypothetical protein